MTSFVNGHCEAHCLCKQLVVSEWKRHCECSLRSPLLGGVPVEWRGSEREDGQRKLTAQYVGTEGERALINTIL